MKKVVRAFLVAIAFAQSFVAFAYPTKPVRLIVQYGAGGSTDVLARLVAKKMSDVLEQQVFVDNRPGANGVLATDAVAKAPADGYTLLFNTNADAANVTLLKNIPYDLERDFAPITLVGAMPHIVVVHPSLGINTLTELISAAKSKPGKLNFASVGIGSTPHLAGELFRIMAGVDIVHIPYKASSQAIAELVGGQVELMFLGAVSGLPHVKSGKLKLLAVTSDRRLPALSDVPTVSEAAKLPGYEATTWWGLLAPAGTPQPVITTLSKAATSVLALPETRDYLNTLGAYAIGNSPEEFARFQKAEIVKWGKIIRDSGATPK